MRKVMRFKMNKGMVPYVVILLISVFIASLSQVMLKKSAQKNYKRTIDEYLNPFVMGAYGLFIVTTFLSVLAYRKVPLSMGALLETTSYLYVTIFGVKVFGEKINRQKLVGLFLIMLGIGVCAI